MREKKGLISSAGYEIQGEDVIISPEQAMNTAFVKRLCAKHRNQIKRVLIRFNEQDDPKQNCVFSSKETHKLLLSKNALKENGITSYLYSDKYRTSYNLEQVIIANNRLDAWAEIINKATTTDRKRRLSPLEKFLYAYLLVANLQRYNLEDEKTEHPITSRGIVDVLSGTRICCAGFANILCALCEKIGIPCLYQSARIIESDKQDCAHAFCDVYIKDEIYGIDDIYSSDPTFDNNQASVLFALIPHSKLKQFYREERAMFDRMDDSLAVNERTTFIKQVKAKTHKFDAVLDKFLQGTNNTVKYFPNEKEDREEAENLQKTKEYIRSVLFGYKTEEIENSADYWQGVQRTLMFGDKKIFKQNVLEMKNKLTSLKPNLTEEQIVNIIYNQLLGEYYYEGMEKYNKILTQIDAKEIDLKTYHNALFNIMFEPLLSQIQMEEVVNNSIALAQTSLGGTINEDYSSTNAFVRAALKKDYSNADAEISRKKENLRFLLDILKETSKKIKILKQKQAEGFDAIICYRDMLDYERYQFATYEARHKYSAYHSPKSYLLDVENELAKLKELKKRKLEQVRHLRESIADLKQEKQDYEGIKIDG